MQLQRQVDEQSGRGKRGASSLKNRLSLSPMVAGHAVALPTTLTACHSCLPGLAGFVFATIADASMRLAARKASRICGAKNRDPRGRGQAGRASRVRDRRRQSQIAVAMVTCPPPSTFPPLVSPIFALPATQMPVAVTAITWAAA